MGRPRNRTAKSRSAAPTPWTDSDLVGITDVREQILRTAYSLYWRRGINAVGVDRIVADAGVAKTSLYRHFRSKEGLIIAVIERHTEVWTRGWLEAEIEQRGETPAEQLLAIFDAFGDWFQQQPFEGCFFINVLIEAHSHPAPIRTAAVAALAEVRALVRDRALAAGARDPVDLAFRVQLLMWGSITAALNGDPGAAECARGLAEQLLRQERIVP